MSLPEKWKADLQASVTLALQEDIGDGDITAELIPAGNIMQASVITRESAVICGVDWVNEVFSQLDPAVHVQWFCHDGDHVQANSTLFSLKGPARSLLTGERAALNFLQLLSGIATQCAEYVALVKGTGVTLLDTRKTIPGLRTAQKYAVTCGGCSNHRIGLYDAFLIKENHISACGSITAAITQARKNHPGKPVEVEVETFAELEEALAARADIIMLDNFSHSDTVKAVGLCKGSTAKLEASGGMNRENLRRTAETGVDYISLGTLTKDVKAIDLSMRIIKD
jgi:nicotinate-nucleotide pyrophosphorylase (carboxylating)